MIKVCILDYGSGNVKSVYNLFSSIADDVAISNDPDRVASASHVVLPGVGAFGAAMRKINERLPVAEVTEAVRAQGKPFLGICVGMQVLADVGTEFGEHDGLGWIGGTVRKLETGGLPLPHIGWNNITAHQSTPLLDGLEGEPDFYYVHSFAFDAADTADVVATTEFGQNFTAIVRRDNIHGVQFHPEKSQKAGIRLAKNFLAMA